MKYKKIVCFLLVGICLLVMGSTSFVFAEENKTDGTYVEGSFTAFEHVVSWDYLYRDDFFLSPSDQYNHDLARLSLGLALATFRDKEHPDAEDDYLIDFLQKLKFEQIETDTYRTETTTNSIGYGLATKDLGDTTLLVCAVCGGNYGKEWAGNLTVGDSLRSDGFQDASVKVQAAIKEYMKKHSVSGNVKLWIAGYSRAAAVSNITAADLTDEGLFEDIYAYTFATPRTTRNPGSYSNIFNIIQKEDMVPKVPLADWGYKRYGKDMFLVSPEMDSNCAQVMSKASELYREMIGSEMVINSEINYQLRTVIDYLLSLMPDSSTYKKYLQPLIIDIVTKDDGTKDALHVLLEALERYSTDDPAAGQELKALRDYLGSMLHTYVFQGTIKELPPGRWDHQFKLTNLFNAHFPFEYLAMMYASDNPNELFSDNTSYIRLVIYADADYTISSGGRVLKEILADGTELVDGKVAPYSLPDADCYKDKTVLTFPADQSYQITLKSNAFLPQTISYTGLLYSGNTVRALSDDLYSCLMNEGDVTNIRTSVNGKAIESSESDYTDISFFTELIYSPTTAMRLETNEVTHLTISGLVNRLLLVIVILLAQMIASIILTIIRKKKGRKRNIVVALIWHSVIVALFAVLEVAMWYFVPVLPIVKLIPAVLVFIVILVYAMKGCRTESKRWKACWIIMGALAAYMILESLLIKDFTLVKGILLLVVYGIFMAIAFKVLWHKKELT